MSQNKYLRRRIAVPAEHGSWALFLSPLLVGYVAGGRWTIACAYLLVAAMVGFMIRQPITALAKVRSGRRPETDLPAIRFWIVVYSVIGALHVYGLVLRGFGYLLYLAVPAVPVAAWHLWLIAHRAERRRLLVEIVGTGVLALSAIAALWVGVGKYSTMGWLLWMLMWTEGGTAVVYMYLRLEQRTAGPIPSLRERLRKGRSALITASVGLVLVLAFAIPGVVSYWLLLPFGIQAAESLRGTLMPATGLRPKIIGIRQLIVTVLFTVTFMLTGSRRGRCYTGSLLHRVAATRCRCRSRRGWRPGRGWGTRARRCRSPRRDPARRRDAA